MQTRCTNEKSKDFKNYGGRGIKVCSEWLGKEGFQHFHDWAMANGYADNLTIDRKNTDGDYKPSNCRWISRAKQNSNRRNVVLLTYQGRTMSCAEWAAELGLSPGTVNNRLHKGWSIEECLFGRKETIRKISNMAVRKKMQELQIRRRNSESKKE